MASIIAALVRGPSGCTTICCDTHSNAVEVIVPPEAGQYDPVGMPTELNIDRLDSAEEESMPPKMKSDLEGESAQRPSMSVAAVKAVTAIAAVEAIDAVDLDADMPELMTARQVENGDGEGQTEEGETCGNLTSTAGTDAADSHAPRKPVKFRIHVEKSEGKKLGLDTVALLSATEGVLRREKGALRVQMVKPDGLVAAWNSEHKRRQVKEGDFIVEVNGVRGTSEELYSVIGRDAILDIQLLRLP
eukprot:CAMPEP_0195102264 /NCGR_PEP_ID=MMETSP0448-20130528/66813_1 /TAXON_ID=66468 /ORGANISM="Heterocapsa triquestra, Strain CCMP 448" /LENGTH=245 /DNA_ID=CAMNT_0040137721 /DNA_START=63 /DNA_END=800 /DNA_ORIENTATION=+